MNCSRWTMVWVSAAISAGCYTYKPVQSPRPGMEVRARLTTDAAVRRSQGLDEPILSVAGRVVESSPEGLTLDVLVARNTSAFQAAELRDTMRFASADLQSLQQRTFSAGRTAIFTIGGAAAAVAVIAGVEQVIGGTGDLPGPGTPNLRAPFAGKARRSITILSFPWSLR